MDMEALTHKTTILLSPREHRLLIREARKSKTTMGEMIRQAIRKLYFKPTRTKGHISWEKLFKINAPVSDWSQMEGEILKGRLSS